MPPIYDDYNDGYDSFTPTITNEKDFAYVESNNTFMHVDHDKNALSNLQTKCIALIGKQIILNFQIVQEVPGIPFINICQRQLLAKQRNKFGNSNWFKSIPILKPC